MSSTEFGAPVVEDATTPATDAAANNGDAPLAIDLNDPQLTSESLDYNPEADAYAAPPPLPDGKWRAKFKALDQKGADGQPVKFKAGADKKSGKPYLYAAHEAHVIDLSGKFDNLRIADYFVSTKPRRDGSIPIATILFKAGVKHQARTHKELMDTYQKWIASEPELGVETMWEVQCEQCDKDAKAKGEYAPRGSSLRGMRKFPPDGKGGFSNEVKCAVDPSHGYSRAQVRISSYLALSELPKP